MVVELTMTAQAPSLRVILSYIWPIGTQGNQHPVQHRTTSSQEQRPSDQVCSGSTLWYGVEWCVSGIPTGASAGM